MARIWSSGFEPNSLTASMEWSTAGGGFSIASTTVRSGTYAGRSAGTSGQISYIFSAANAQAAFYGRVYVYFVAFPGATRDIVYFQDSSNSSKASIRINTNGTLTLRNLEDSADIGSSSAINLNQWYRLELKLDNTTLSATSIDACVDGVSFASGTVDHASGVTKYVIGNNSSQNLLDVYFDDIALNDGSGSFQNSWPGPGKIIYLRPSAAGDINTFATQTGGTAGAANNFTRVNQVTPDDATTLNGSNTLDQEDLFNVSDSGIGVSDIINVVSVGGRFRNNSADAATALMFEIEKTSGGTVLQSAAIKNNSTTWRTNAIAAPFNYPLTLYQDPDNVNWTQTTLDSMQIGYKITTGGTNRMEVTNVWALVDYTPSVAPTSTGNFFQLF